MSYKAHMYGGRESSGGIVLTKRSNAGQGGPKEIAEGRPLAKENVDPSIPAPDTVPDECANTRLVGVLGEAYALRGDPRWEPCALVARARFCAGGGQ